MTRVFDSDLLEVLQCDISARPAAPGPAELEPYLVAIERGDDSLALQFAPGARGLLHAFVAAEQQCCATLDWRTRESATGPVLELRATAAQLDAFATAWSISGGVS